MRRKKSPIFILLVYDSKAGACGSVAGLFRKNSFNHTPVVYAGIMEDGVRSL